MTRTVPWKIAASDRGADAALAREAGVSELLAGLLRARGVRSAAEAAAFLSPCESELHDPDAMLGVPQAAELLLDAARRGRRIVVFGDYDVDGVTAVAQLRAALRRVGADAAAFIPHRLRDGYGLKPATVRKVLAELSPAVIVTVDCGISAVEGVAAARAAGVEVIVTDHHLVPDALPAGAVVVNPRQPGCDYPYKELAACGIAMKIAQSLARRAGVALSTDSLLRAACLGTIADLVPLTGENRAIAARGLRALASARAPGLRALLAESGIAPGTPPTSEEVAFRVGPRLNAAGRIDTAELALSLFEERDGPRAAGTARELSVRNAERQCLERRVVDSARRRVEDDPRFHESAVIILADPGWHRGVLGIAASRLAREYHRPVLLFGVDGEKASGSGRSIPGVPLHAILEQMRDHFTEFGGHEAAVGATLPVAGFEAFAAAARAGFAERVPAEALQRVDEADAELPLGAVTDAVARELARLEPHGAGNAAPVFLARRARAAGPFAPAGETGLKGRLVTETNGSGSGSRNGHANGGGTSVRCIAWKPAADLAPMAAGGAAMDVLYRVCADRGWGRQVEILGARASDLPEGA